MDRPNLDHYSFDLDSRTNYVTAPNAMQKLSWVLRDLSQVAHEALLIDRGEVVQPKSSPDEGKDPVAISSRGSALKGGKAR